MGTNIIPGSVSDILQTVQETRKHYRRVESDPDLDDAFHKSGQALRFVDEALQYLKSVPNRDLLSSESKNSLKACGEKARVSMRVFQAVAEGSATSRFRSYKDAVKNEREKVECLLIEMMTNLCSSIPEEQPGSHFIASDAANQFNNLGSGTQNNNPGNGNQFPGAIFNGSLHFGKCSPQHEG
ncbi:hypothetical protein F5B22DRAFT_528325 [Xylaria bambusicola]|uniref:uncharacterized protein n=1 Tax=Xylaria bambusicola TaxID=326684 RepID=UPI0020077CD0|nr:uncharacterized protein F5B22DRAFT_528325 [Xylaria bambusicola]KAI0505321.1 hypothetical protein F5B22DRAFT_528325 [Xylaria bambusicola]